MFLDKRISRLLRDQTGLSLVEVMTAIGVMSIMAFSLIQLMAQSQKSIKTLEMKVEQIDFSSALKLQLASQNSCTTALSAITIPPASLAPGAAIPLPSNQIVLQGSLLSSRAFESFMNPTVTFNVTSVPAAGQALGILTINLEPKTQFSNFLKLKAPVLNFGVRVDAAGAILNCPDVAPVSSFSATDCYMIDENVGKGNTVTRTCNPGYGLLFGSGIPSGSEDGTGSTHLRLTENSIWVNADEDSWRILAKCCRAN